MSRTYKDSPKGRRQPRRISIRAVRRDPPDLRKLRRALVELAMTQAAAEAEAVADQKHADRFAPPTEPDHD